MIVAKNNTTRGTMHTPLYRPFKQIYQIGSFGFNQLILLAIWP